MLSEKEGALLLAMADGQPRYVPATYYSLGQKPDAPITFLASLAEQGLLDAGAGSADNWYQINEEGREAARCLLSRGSDG